jgi:hypothetical protein
MTDAEIFHISFTIFQLSLFFALRGVPPSCCLPPAACFLPPD